MNDKAYREVKSEGKTYVLFRGGPFCQWARSIFVDEGVTYCSAEQYMMAQKAKLFGDTAQFNRITGCSNSREIKQMGRRVRNFNEERWVAAREGIVLRGNELKFAQCEAMRQELLKYDEGSRFVECSPSDRIWGIGLSEEDYVLFLRNREQTRCAGSVDDEEDEDWGPGKNLLGKAITKVRKNISLFKQ